MVRFAGRRLQSSVTADDEEETGCRLMTFNITVCFENVFIIPLSFLMRFFSPSSRYMIIITGLSGILTTNLDSQVQSSHQRMAIAATHRQSSADIIIPNRQSAPPPWVSLAAGVLRFDMYSGLPGAKQSVSAG